MFTANINDTFKKGRQKTMLIYCMYFRLYIYIIDLFNVYYMDAHDKNYAFALSAV